MKTLGSLLPPKCQGKKEGQQIQFTTNYKNPKGLKVVKGWVLGNYGSYRRVLVRGFGLG